MTLTRHERERITDLATLEIEKSINSIIQKHNLTYGEMLYAINKSCNNCLRSLARWMIDEERKASIEVE